MTTLVRADLLGGEVRGQHHRDDGIGETRRPRHGGRPSVDRGDAIFQVMRDERRRRGAGDAEPRAPALLIGEGDGEPRQAGRVVHGPVERIDDPARALAGPLAPASSERIAAPGVSARRPSMMSFSEARSAAVTTSRCSLRVTPMSCRCIATRSAAARCAIASAPREKAPQVGHGRVWPG